MQSVETVADLIELLSGLNPEARIRVAVDEPEDMEYKIDLVAGAQSAVWLAIGIDHPDGPLPPKVADAIYRADT